MLLIFVISHRSELKIWEFRYQPDLGTVIRKAGVMTRLPLFNSLPQE